MKHRLFLLFVLIGCLTVAVAPAQGQPAPTKVFTDDAPEDSYSGTADNWDPPNEPQPTDVVFISASKTATIAPGDDDAVAQVLIVVGTLEIKEGAKLTMGSTGSDFGYISGTVDLEGGTWTIDGTSSYVSSGPAGAIHMSPSGSVPATIDGNATLTLADDIRCSPITVTGRGNINVNLVNDATIEATGDSLSVNGGPTGSPLSGSGLWKASDGGELVINVSVTGDSRWWCTPGNDWSMIRINAQCSVTGWVRIDDGDFRVVENFCTTGDLTFTADPGGSPGQPSWIVVHPNKTAAFKAVKCPDIP